MISHICVKWWSSKSKDNSLQALLKLLTPQMCYTSPLHTFVTLPLVKVLTCERKYEATLSGIRIFRLKRVRALPLMHFCIPDIESYLCIQSYIEYSLSNLNSHRVFHDLFKKYYS